MAARPYPQSRSWCFTLNNPETDDIPRGWDVTYVVWQREEGASRTPHLQGFVYLPARMRLSGVKRLNDRAHWEPARGTPEQNKVYCTKADTRVSGPWELGVMPVPSGVMEQDRWKKARELASTGHVESIDDKLYICHYGALKRIEKDHPLKLDQIPSLPGRWYFGPSGTGKSSTARKEYPDAYIKTANKWWDGYRGEESVIIDDLDPCHKVLAHHLKIWGDHYPFPAEVKGGMIMIRPKVIIVTSQYGIADIFDPADAAALARRYASIPFYLTLTL